MIGNVELMVIIYFLVYTHPEQMNAYYRGSIDISQIKPTSHWGQPHYHHDPTGSGIDNFLCRLS